jgi:hypothetical protein
MQPRFFLEQILVLVGSVVIVEEMAFRGEPKEGDGHTWTDEKQQTQGRKCPRGAEKEDVRYVK